MVPSTEFQSPTASAPAPSWAAQPSVAPEITGVPSGNPVSAAAAADTVPSGVPERTSGGSTRAGTPRASVTSDGHRSPMRSAPVFKALDRSVATGPPTSRWLTKSL